MPTSSPLELILFEHDAVRIPALRDAGITSFLVDLELMGKDRRQLGFDTDISPGDFDALDAMSPIAGIVRWCRLNAFGDWSVAEIERAIGCGVDVLILPMVRDAATVERFLKAIGGRCRSCIMLETRETLAVARELDGLGVDYAYFGLNDYRIDLGNPSLFDPLADGTLAAVRAVLNKVAFGFGGLTDMRRGSPIPSLKILEELERLDCRLSFLRRSFKKDSADLPVATIVNGIHAAWRDKAGRTAAARAADHASLLALLERITI